MSFPFSERFIFFTLEDIVHHGKSPLNLTVMTVNRTSMLDRPRIGKPRWRVKGRRKERLQKAVRLSKAVDPRVIPLLPRLKHTSGAAMRNARVTHA